MLRQLVQRSYRNNLESTRDFVVRYTGTDTRGQSHIVHTTARSRNNGRAPEVGIDYELRQNGGSWKVTDVVKEGDKVKVKLLGFDDRGKVRLSMKAVDQKTGEDLEKKGKADGEGEAAE